VEILSNEKPRDTWGSGELRFYFMLAVPDGFTLIWALNKGFAGYSKARAGHPVTRNITGINWGASGKLET
jgi:hypothetical protein